MRIWSVKVDGKPMFSSANLEECAKWVNDYRHTNGYRRCSISSFMNLNELWQKHFPHLSPKEAHAELMQMFPEGGYEQ